jgi:hypothetical protein
VNIAHKSKFYGRQKIPKTKFITMKSEHPSSTSPKKGHKPDSKDNTEGYPLYPPKEDIYNQGQKESDIDPDDLTPKKQPNVDPNDLNEKDFDDDRSGSDLDVPGAELDDDMEDIGSEDEENNYFSLGQ